LLLATPPNCREYLGERSTRAKWGEGDRRRGGVEGGMMWKSVVLSRGGVITVRRETG